MIFAWGDVIYNPRRVSITPCLEAHEKTHAIRQAVLGGPELWWERYLQDAAFRLAEEVIAHHVEYQVRVRELSGKDCRINRRRLFQETARRLASPIYGYALPVDRARGLLKQFDKMATKKEEAVA